MGGPLYLDKTDKASFVWFLHLLIFFTDFTQQASCAYLFTKISACHVKMQKINKSVSQTTLSFIMTYQYLILTEQVNYLYKHPLETL